MRKFILFSILTLALAGCTNSFQSGEEDASAETQTDPSLEMTQKAQYVAFTQERYTQLLGKEPFVIFFHANWCATCVQLEKEIMKDLSNFPEGTKILKADYDTETKLKQNYGITLQSMLVVLDKNGKVITILTAPSIDQLKSAIIESI